MSGKNEKMVRSWKCTIGASDYGVFKCAEPNESVRLTDRETLWELELQTTIVLKLGEWVNMSRSVNGVEDRAGPVYSNSKTLVCQSSEVKCYNFSVDCHGFWSILRCYFHGVSSKACLALGHGQNHSVCVLRNGQQPNTFARFFSGSSITFTVDHHHHR